METDRYPPENEAQAQAAFEEAWPVYRATARLDALRRSEYARLDDLGHIYLDYTGGSLYGAGQVRRHLDRLQQQVWGNPRSSNPGAGEIAHGLTAEEMEEAFRDQERMTFEQFLSVVLRKHYKSAGAIRVSLGLTSNVSDVYRFLRFAEGFLDRA